MLRGVALFVIFDTSCEYVHHDKSCNSLNFASLNFSLIKFRFRKEYKPYFPSGLKTCPSHLWSSNVLGRSFSGVWSHVVLAEPEYFWAIKSTIFFDLSHV